ncbi:DMT family transporter [Clostridium oryzae]|uniref:EamA-like transporter family protein n=1 Tax=Clostridium oryzae TaxID=1450648 RepID=A0A1V4IQI3_9CLOT|nr:DMT family transporter [Clostridium oryzae]OPJ62288.1 hypothetical protein CLORY_19030 [Clostridium oryzae]
MLYVLLATIAGISMSVQGVFNTRLSSKIGYWHTNVIVQGTAFIVCIIVMFLVKEPPFTNIKASNKLYLTGGILGVIITFTVMKSIRQLSPTCAVSVILIAQLTAAALIDAFGLFDSDKVTFGIQKIIGVIIMIIGIVVFKYKC